MTEGGEKVRVDKWLWSVRIFKSRSQATDACRTSQVKVNGEEIKPSSTVAIDDVISVRKGGFHLTFKVRGLIEKRVSAALAKDCYEDLTPPEERSKFKDWFIGKAKPEMREKGTGRPTKKDRRILDVFKGREED